MTGHYFRPLYDYVIYYEKLYTVTKRLDALDMLDHCDIPGCYAMHNQVCIYLQKAPAK